MGGLASRGVRRTLRAIVERSVFAEKQSGKGFQNVHDLGAGTAKAAKTVRQMGGAYEEEGPQQPAGEPAASWQKFEPHLAKFSGRAPQGQSTGQAPRTAVPGGKRRRPLRSTPCSSRRSRTSWQTLYRLRDLAYGNGLDGPWTSPGNRRSCRRGNS